MFSSPTSRSAGLDRKRGMARISAVTLGVGAASVLGAVAIAGTLPDPAVSAASSGNAAALGAGTSTGTRGDDGAISEGKAPDDDTSASQPQPGPTSQSQSGATTQRQSRAAPQLQSGVAPMAPNGPPVATSGGS